MSRSGLIGVESEVACQDPEAPLQLGGIRGCGRVPSVLTGFVPDGTRRLDVELGNGRTVAVPVRPLPFGRTGRMVAAVLPACTGAPPRDRGGRGWLRARPRHAARGPAGSALRRRPLRGLALPRPSESRGSASRRRRKWRPRSRQGGPRLLIRDAGERICVGVDRVELDDAACSAPRFSAHQTSVYADLDRGLVAGSLPGRNRRDRAHVAGWQRERPAPGGRGHGLHRPLPERLALRLRADSRRAAPPASSPC